MAYVLNIVTSPTLPHPTVLNDPLHPILLYFYKFYYASLQRTSSGVNE